MTEDHNIVIAIAGGSGAGKSSLAEAFATVLGERATSVRQDWYFRHVLEGTGRPSSQAGFHHPDNVDFVLLADDLEALRSGRSVGAPSAF